MVPLMPEANKLVALCLCVLLTAGAWIPLATMGHERTTAEADTTWEVRTSGTRSDPILIYTLDDLQNMSNDIAAHYALANDIDASATRDWNEGAGFEPIGPGPIGYPANRFTGSLDGGGYTITGLYIDRSDTDYVGLFGHIVSGSTITNVGLVDADVTGYQFVGGFVGWNMGGSVSDSYATGSVNGERWVGGLVGTNSGGSVNNSHYNIDTVLINGANHVTLGGLFHDQYQDWFDSGMKLDIADYGSTLVPSGNHFEISTVNGLRDLLGFAGTAGFTFRLVSDIDLSTAPGLYIPHLAAEFDGNYHTISNHFINQNFSSDVGLFGSNSGGMIRRVALVDADVTGDWQVGGLVGLNFYGSVENCYATGNVSGTNGVGGLVGWNSNGSVVSNSYATGSVSGTNWVGGLLGGNGGSVENCYATGNVSGTNWVGGLVGENYRGSVSDSYATGSVTGERWVGGLVGGYVDGGSVENSFYDRDTTGQSDTGKGTPKSTWEMKTRSTFTDAGWDFSGTWTMVEDTTYPLLRRQDDETREGGRTKAVMWLLLAVLAILLFMVFFLIHGVLSIPPEMVGEPGERRGTGVGVMEGGGGGGGGRESRGAGHERRGSRQDTHGPRRSGGTG